MTKPITPELPELDFKKIYSEEYVSNCCQEKMIVSEGKYELKFWCTKCELPCTPNYSEIERLIFGNFCYEDGDGDELDSWDGYFFKDDANPYHLAYLIKKQLAQKDAECERRVEEATKNYIELLMAVGNKYPGETRHETALRYIRQAEQSSDVASEATTQPKDQHAN